MNQIQKLRDEIIELENKPHNSNTSQKILEKQIKLNELKQIERRKEPLFIG